MAFVWGNDAKSVSTWDVRGAELEQRKGSFCDELVFDADELGVKSAMAEPPSVVFEATQNLVCSLNSP